MTPHHVWLLPLVSLAPLFAQGERTTAVVTPMGVFLDRALGPASGAVGPLNSPQGLRWVYPQTTTFSITEHVAVGNHGTMAWLAENLNNQRLSLVSTTDTNTPPAFIYEVSKLGADDLRVKAADKGPYAAVVTIVSGVSTLEFYSCFSPTPLWSLTANTYLLVDISETGRYVATGFSPTTTTAEVDVYDAFSATPTTPIAVLTATTNGLRQFDLSDDGSTVLLATHVADHVFDVATQTQIFQDNTTVSHDAHAISRDGRAWGRGGFNPLRAWVLNNGTYNNVLTYSDNALGFAVFNAGAMSNDGHTFVAAAYDAITYLGLTVYCWDLTPTSSTLLWRYHSGGSGTLQDVPSAMSISDDGTIIAVGSWGDQGNTHPEAILFARNGGGVPLNSVDTPGSVFDLDLSGDGQFLVIGTKAVHANTRGNGGEGYSFDLGGQSHWLRGTVSINRTVDLDTAGNPGELVFLGFAGGLAAPTTVPGIGGTLELDLSSFFGSFTAGTVPASGVNVFSLPVPNVTSLIGVQLAVQAVHGPAFTFTNALRLPITQ